MTGSFDIHTGHAVEHPAKFSMEGLTSTLSICGETQSPVTLKSVNSGKHVLPPDILLIMQDLLKKVVEAVAEFDDQVAILGLQVEAGNLAWVNGYELRWEAHDRLRVAAQVFQEKKYQSQEHAELVKPFNKHLGNLLDYEDLQIKDLTDMKDAFGD